jgi:hypothetical protein
MAFTLDDAEKLALLRAYVVTMDKKTIDVWANDKTGDCVKEAIAAIRKCLEALSDLQKECQKSKTDPEGEPECRDGYEPCEDGVCRVWCS